MADSLIKNIWKDIRSTYVVFLLNPADVVLTLAKTKLLRLENLFNCNLVHDENIGTMVY